MTPSGKNDWLTPFWFLDLVREIGPIALDPCADASNRTAAERFYSRESDWRASGIRLGPCGLRGSWDRDGLAFVNPPYGRHLGGPVDPGAEIKRLGETIGHGTGWARRIAEDEGEWIALVPSRTDAAWYHTLLGAADVTCLWRSKRYGSRIHFCREDGSKATGTNYPSSVFYRGDRLDKFWDTFAGHGWIF